MEISELIKELRRYGLSNGGSLGRHMGIMDIAADALEELTRCANPEDKAQWVPVSKRLPENDETLPRFTDSTIELTSVLACGHLDGDEKLSVQEVNRLLIKKTGIKQLDINYTGKWEWSNCFKEVLYWQPLPQPPKESAEQTVDRDDDK